MCENNAQNHELRQLTLYQNPSNSNTEKQALKKLFVILILGYKYKKLPRIDLTLS